MRVCFSYHHAVRSKSAMIQNMHSNLDGDFVHTISAFHFLTSVEGRLVSLNETMNITKGCFWFGIIYNF